MSALRRFRVAALVSLGALAVVLWTPAGPGRLIAALFLFFAAPGLALAPALGFRGEVWWWLTGVIAISLATDVLVAQVVLYTVGFSWRPCAVGLTGIACLGSLLQGPLEAGIRRLRPLPPREEAAGSND